MLRLKTFGGLWLEGDEGRLTGAAAQRRRLVLLAALAAAMRPSSDLGFTAYASPNSRNVLRHSCALGSCRILVDFPSRFPLFSF